MDVPDKPPPNYSKRIPVYVQRIIERNRHAKEWRLRQKGITSGTEYFTKKCRWAETWEVADMLKVSRWTLRRYMTHAGLPYLKIRLKNSKGGYFTKTRFDLHEVEAWLQKRAYTDRYKGQRTEADIREQEEYEAFMNHEQDKEK